VSLGSRFESVGFGEFIAARCRGECRVGLSGMGLNIGRVVGRGVLVIPSPRLNKGAKLSGIGQ
jgi:hypothetical protein